jgi:origin recognition complex subunit 1
MPSATILPAEKPKKRNSTALSKARDRLRGVLREDSDDELGDEDYPWEWVYSNDPGERNRIIGARMGSFDVQIGDCILIKGEGLKGEAYVGMACEFYSDKDDEDNMLCNVMWFSTESEIRAGAKKRTDFLPVRILFGGKRISRLMSARTNYI